MDLHSNDLNESALFTIAIIGIATFVRFFATKGEAMHSRLLYTFAPHVGVAAAIFLASCGYRHDEDIRKAEEFCANVTDQNWHIAQWSDRSAKEVCMDNADRALQMGGDVKPCNFGGLPMFCSRKDDGGMVIFLGPPLSFDVHPDDVDRVLLHVVMF